MWKYSRARAPADKSAKPQASPRQTQIVESARTAQDEMPAMATSPAETAPPPPQTHHHYRRRAYRASPARCAAAPETPPPPRPIRPPPAKPIKRAAAAD